jgi:hypothetical protein
MTVTAYLVWFIFMAVATMTILVVGTLAAAGLLHRSRRESQSEAGSSRNADLVEALMPLGSSLSFGSQLKSHTAEDPGTDSEDPHHGEAA